MNFLKGSYELLRLMTRADGARSRMRAFLKSKDATCVVALGSTYHRSIRVARTFTLLFGNRQARFIIVQFRTNDA
jgi:hypothetical protein